MFSIEVIDHFTARKDDEHIHVHCAEGLCHPLQHCQPYLTLSAKRHTAHITSVSAIFRLTRLSFSRPLSK